MPHWGCVLSAPQSADLCFEGLNSKGRRVERRKGDRRKKERKGKGSRALPSIFSRR